MARLVFGMNPLLDGYVGHMALAPPPELFRHFIEETEMGSLYDRQMYDRTLLERRASGVGSR